MSSISNLQLFEPNITMEREYYSRLSRILCDLYPTICRDCLQKQLPPSQCQNAADKIRTLRPAQLNVTRNVAVRGDYGECDMPLMYILASCGCGSLPPPSAGWGKSPITGTGIADDIERMMSIYRKVVDSLPEEGISEEYYNDCIDVTRSICTRLDTINAFYLNKTITTSYEKMFDALQKQSMNETEYKSYAKQIKELQQKEDEIMNERENFFRLSRIVGDLYTTVYHDVLVVQLPPNTCPTPRNLGINVNKEERTVLNDVRVDNSYRKCDISLMYKLFRNACPSLPVPTAGWDKPVPPLAIGVSDDIERIRQTRNKAFGHISSTPVSESEYKQYVQTAKGICNRMDSTHTAYLQKSVSRTYLQELNKILTENLDTEMYRSYVDILTNSAKKDEDILIQITETGLETRKSISKAEGNIVKAIREEELETQKEMKALDKKLTGITTENLIATQQSILEAEGNIVQKITAEELDTKKEIKTLDKKLTGIATEHYIETLNSISKAEVNIIKTMAEEEEETRTDLRSLGKMLTDISAEYRVDMEARSKAEKEIKGKLAAILKMEKEKNVKMKEKDVQDSSTKRFREYVCKYGKFTCFYRPYFVNLRHLMYNRVFLHSA